MEKWYIIRCATNKEKESRDKIENKLKYTDTEKYVKQVIVPTEHVVQLRKGKPVITTRNNYPGYILIETDEIALGDLSTLFKGINYVTGFLGSRGVPSSLKQAEVDVILGRMEELQGQEPVITFEFLVGETIKINDGPFTDFVGKISEFNKEKNKLKINVLVFGRETPIELDVTQVSKEL